MSIITKIKEFIKDKHIYKNKKRTGVCSSQSEEVQLIDKNHEFEVKGYQHYIISRNKIIPLDKQLKLKSDYLTPILKRYSYYSSLIDIGASNGYFVFLSKHLGYDKLCLLDHDTNYNNISKNLIQKLNLSHMEVVTDKFGKDCGSYDVVLFLALIHWVYSCTSVFGAFDPVIEKLYQMTSHVLIIEWIDPQDAAIKDFGHLDFNRRKIKEKYCEKNFLKSLSKYFNSYECLGHYQSETRKIYVAFKDFLDNQQDAISFEVKGETLPFHHIVPCNALDKGTSKIYYCPSRNLVLKKCTHFLEDGVFEREIFWLKRLESYDFVPNLIHVDHDEKIIVTSYLGRRINKGNAPEDWREQLQEIMTVFKKEKLQNTDLKETEVLVNQKKLGIIDFGWASLGGDYSCGIGLPDGTSFSHIKELKTPNDIFKLIQNKLRS